jgi:hypothetical protein
LGQDRGQSLGTGHICCTSAGGWVGYAIWLVPGAPPCLACNRCCRACGWAGSLSMGHDNECLLLNRGKDSKRARPRGVQQRALPVCAASRVRWIHVPVSQRSFAVRLALGAATRRYGSRFHDHPYLFVGSHPASRAAGLPGLCTASPLPPGSWHLVRQQFDESKFYRTNKFVKSRQNVSHYNAEDCRFSCFELAQ